MKSILILFVLSGIFISCNENKEDMTSKKQPTLQQNNADSQPSGIAEENDMCICTKDYRPVCGKNGQTYPNPCQAGCEKVEIDHQGPCEG